MTKREAGAVQTFQGGNGQACLLDLTRLVSRAGRMPTGIDRVEAAWLGHLLQRDGQVFGLVRTGLGYLLLDRRGMAQMAEALARNDWGKVGLLARLTSRRPDEVRAAETMLRGVAVARCLRWGLGRMLRRYLPGGGVALNVGHANLSDQTLSALRGVTGLHLVVMIHDTIPLDWPEFQRDGTVASFAAKFRAAARHADRIICPSQSAADDIARNLGPGRRPPVTVTPLGVDPVAPDPGALPQGLSLDAPFFVALGTIEPRKNHAVLLDAWERLGPDAPWLFICGARGWKNVETFARLDRRPSRIQELAGLSDGAVAALLDRACALLFPSLAEGYGLPLAEAAVLGTPLLCSDIPVCREVAGAGATYLDPRDPAAWAAEVRRIVALPPLRQPSHAPDWQGHFKTVLGVA
jgi:glycosyltransferase involved in cell wall biosynthesis